MEVDTNTVVPAVALASTAADSHAATGGGELRVMASIGAHADVTDAPDAGAASEAAREDMARGCMTHTQCAQRGEGDAQVGALPQTACASRLKCE